MNILISNDDGYFSEGIQVLKASLLDAGHTVFMVAPDRNNSGSGMAITLRKPVVVRQISEREYAVSGTPVDCVCLALRGLIESDIGLVVSGINNGDNLGDDIFYSGTVAAAMEARRLKYPSLAVSMTASHPRYFSTAAHVINQLINDIDNLPAKEEMAFLNINVPDVPLKELKGIKAARLGVRGNPVVHKEKIISDTVRYCWIGPAGEFGESSEEDANQFDYELVQQGFAAVTPVKAQWLHEPYIDSCNEWLAKN